jgi:ribosomal-protein-alanine N-acetyltransferase
MNLHLEKLDIRHIDLGWYEWLQTVDPLSFTEVTARGVTRSDLESLILTSDSDLWFAVYVSDSHLSSPQYIGNVHIGPIDWISRVCEFGRFIGNKDFRGKGLGSKLTSLILNYCFNVLNMNRVKAGCLAVNIAAHKTNIKAGMTHEATLRQEKYQDGVYHDVYYFGILRSEFNQSSP